MYSNISHEVGTYPDGNKEGLITLVKKTCKYNDCTHMHIYIVFI